MELRFGWGLRADEAWVQQVADDPNSVSSPLGIPVTPDEAQELQRMIAESPRTALIMYGAREHQQFGGLWVNEPGVGMVLLFTGDLDRHRQALNELANGQPFGVRLCRFSEEELRALQDSLVSEVERTPGLQMMSIGVDTKNNVVVLEGKSNDPALGQRLEAAHGGRLVARIFPLPGPWQNVAAGPGWRLIAAGTSRTEAYTIRVATTDEEWQQLWTAVDPVNPRPPADLANEIVVSFGHGIGSSCPERRLDGVGIDPFARRVFSDTSDPLAPRNCTADLAGGAFFLVGLARDQLPESPFTVVLNRDPVCRDCAAEPSVTVDLR